MKTKKMKLTIAVFSMLLCLSTFAQGRQGGRGGQGGQQRGEKPDASKILEDLDTNNDDKINKDEASKDRRGKIAKDFDIIDANEDGFIDLEELKASLNNRGPRKVSAAQIIKEVDQDEDGFLNELEVAAKNKRRLVKNFSIIDTNQDGQLDIDELKVFYSKRDDKKNRRD